MCNLWVSNLGCNFFVGWNGVFNFVNNVVFNWVYCFLDGGDYIVMFNMINNYYKLGLVILKDIFVGYCILKFEVG